jgi:hypothetical protein
MDGTHYNDEPCTPSMKYIQALISESSHFRDNIILPSQSNDKGYIGIYQSGSMMSLPVDISRGPEEDEKEVQEGVCGYEGDLTDIAEIE